MSMFYCDGHQQMEDSDHVGFHEAPDGRTLCDEAEDDRIELEDFAQMTLSAQREAMGGEWGGDGEDD